MNCWSGRKKQEMIQTPERRGGGDKSDIIKVLHVDDEPDFLDVAKAFLEVTDEIKVDCAVSAKEVLAKGPDFLHDFDAVISDYQMPDMDGLQFLNAFKSLKIDMPFILFTGRGREEVAMQALNAGAEFYLTKGGDPKSQFAELANMIKHSVERRQAQRSLEHNARRFRLLIENASDMISVVDKEGVTVYASPSTHRVLGYRPEEFVGKNLVEIVHPDDMDFVMRIFEKVLSEESNFVIEEARIRHKDGSWRILEATARLVYSEEGAPQVIVNSRDVTDRKRAEIEVAHLNSVLRTVVGVNRAVVTERDPEKMLRRVCNTLVERGCYRNAWIALVDDRDQVLLAVGAGLGDDWKALKETLLRNELPRCFRKALDSDAAVLIDETDQVCGDCPVRSEAHGIGAMSVRLRHEGTVYGAMTVELSAGFTGYREELDLLDGMADDIAFALRGLETEVRLRESEETYKAIFDNTGTTMAIVEEDGRIVLVNDEFQKLVGIGRGEIEGKRKWAEFVHPDDLPKMLEYHRSRRIDPSLAPRRYEARIIDGSGAVRDLLVTVGMIPGTNRSIASALDITEHKRTETFRDRQ